jgi:hypothetical protein
VTLDDLLRERTSELRMWASSRIRHCREQETKFGTSWEHRPKHQNGPPQALVEAWTERRALQAVLGILEGSPQSSGEPKP